MPGTRASHRPRPTTRPTPPQATPFHPRAHDTAVIPVLEAIIIALIVGGAMIFAASFQTAPPPAAAPGAEELEERSWDAFSTLDGMYYEDPSAANSSLSKAVRDALAGQPENLTEALATYLPPGAQFNVYLNNGFDRLAVHESRAPTGQTVGISYPFEPRWRTVFAESDLRYYGAPASPELTMGVTTIPVFNSNLVMDEGHLVKAEAHGTQEWVPGLPATPKGGNQGYTEAAYATLLQGNQGTDYTSVAIYMGCKDGTGLRPCYAMDLSQSGTNPDHEPSEADKVPITIENTGPGILPAGAMVEVRLPVGLPVESTWDTDDPDRDWSIGTFGRAPAPTTVKARLAGELGPNEEATFQINVTRTDSRYAFKKVTATLQSPATTSQSQFLLKVQDKTEGTQTGGDTRVLLVSGPQPAGSKDGSSDPRGRWGLVLTNPVKSTELSSVTFSLPDGPGILEEAAYPADVSGVYDTIYPPNHGVEDVQPDHFNWSSGDADHEIPAWSFVELQFEVTTDGRFTQASPKFPPHQPRVIYDGYTPGGIAHQADPGVWWEEFAPQTTTPTPLPGYPTQTSTLQSRLDYRNHLLQGSAIYKVDGDLDPQTMITIQDALRAATVTPSDRRVPIGEVVNVEVDARDLATVLASELPINDLNLTTKIYAPWGITHRVPDKTVIHTARAGFLHRPVDLEIQDLDDDGVDDVIASYSDGNIYSLVGKTGAAVPGSTWSVPEDEGSPTYLAKGWNGTEPFYAVGTTRPADKAYVVDLRSPAEHLWAADTSSVENVRVLDVNASLDVDGDLVDDVVLVTPNRTTDGKSRLLLLDGATGSLVPGAWSTGTGEGVVINGTSQLVGMGRLGPHARTGVYASTGMTVATNTQEQLEGVQDGVEGTDPHDPGGIVRELAEATKLRVGISGAGLRGFYDDGTPAWNYTGGRFIKILNADQVPTGGDWTGMVAGGADGWLYGFNGSKPIMPVHGSEIIGAQAIDDIDMANDLSGYMPSRDGRLWGTTSGWTDWKAYTITVDGTPTTRTYPGVRTVATPDAPYNSSASQVSWWAGKTGLVVRSTDYLETTQDMTGTAEILSTLQLLDDGSSTLDLEPPSDLDMTKIDLTDAWTTGADEAWFVGGGAEGTNVENKAYIAHTTDGGASFLVTEVECRDALLTLFNCHLRGVEHDGDRLWVVGEQGTALVQDDTGKAGQAGLNTSQPTPKVQSQRLWVALDAGSATELSEVQVLWTPKDDLSSFREIRLHTAGTGGSGNRVVWENATGATYVTGGRDTYGARRGAIIDLTGYDLGVNGDADHNWLTGSKPAWLKIGPFTNTTTAGDIKTNDFPSPVNLTLVLTYGDGSQNLITVGHGPGSAGDVERPYQWAPPSDVGYTTPACFGAPNEDCTTLHSINFTTDRSTGQRAGVAVGAYKEGSTVPAIPTHWTMYKLPWGTTTWGADEDLPGKITLYDVAISPKAPHRWAATGEEGRVYASYDGGITWSDMPTPGATSGDNAVMRSLDMTHADVGYLVGGGDETGRWWSLDGYTESGRAVTQTYSPGYEVEKIVPAPDRLELILDAYDRTSVDLEVRDPGLSGATGGWVEVLNADGWVHEDGYRFSQPTDTLEFRLTLSTVTGYPRVSPQIGGKLDVDLYADKDDPAPTGDLTLDFSKNIWTSRDQLDIPASKDHDHVRLKPVHNVWVTKLGDTEQWDTGARVADLDLSPDGSIVYVSTEGVYEHGDTPGTPPIRDDNTVYAFNVDDGTPVAGFTPWSFDNPPVIVRALETGFYAVTQGPQDSQLAMVWLFDTTGSRIDSASLGHGNEVVDMAVARIFGSTRSDGVLAVWHPATGSGRIVTVDSGDGTAVELEWMKMPQVKGLFDFGYKVPRNGMYGAHVLETEFNWTMLTDDGRSITQSAKIHGAFTATPPNRKVALSPTYTLELVAWMEDWG